jgi:hypothetical protein
MESIPWAASKRDDITELSMRAASKTEDIPEVNIKTDNRREDTPRHTRGNYHKSL